LATSPLRLTTSNFFFQLITCGHSPYVTFSLTSRWVCPLQLPAQSFSGPSPVGLMTTFYCLRFKSTPTWRVRSPYLYPPGTGWPRYIPRHWVPFLSSLTTHSVMIEVFDPLHMGDWLSILTVLVKTSWHGPHRKHRSSIVACIFVAAGTCLLSCCPETAVVYSPISWSLHNYCCTRYNRNTNFIVMTIYRHYFIGII
jgi:hypothetical protein